MVRLIVLNDNEPGPGLLNEWGWSLYVETRKDRILFDANSNYRVLEHNSRILGINLGSINYGVLSHWHKDHYGGFSIFTNIKKLKVYAPPGPTYKLERLGLDVEVVREMVELDDGIVVLPPLNANGIQEISMSIPSDRGRILVVGCSHPGIDKIAEEHLALLGEKPFLVIGGFHGPSTRVLDRLAMLVEGPICAAHCSGDDAKNYIRLKYKDKSCNVRTGSILSV